MPPTYRALVATVSGEVVQIAERRDNGFLPDFADADPLHFTVLDDPIMPNGDRTRDKSGPKLGPVRQLGFAKIYRDGVIRNATQIEIDTFAPAMEAVREAQDIVLADQLLTTSKLPHGRMNRAMAVELNAANDLLEDVFDAIASSSNFAQMKAALVGKGRGKKTKAQIMTSLKARIGDGE